MAAYCEKTALIKGEIYEGGFLIGNSSADMYGALQSIESLGAELPFLRLNHRTCIADQKTLRY